MMSKAGDFAYIVVPPLKAKPNPQAFATKGPTALTALC